MVVPWLAALPCRDGGGKRRWIPYDGWRAGRPEPEPAEEPGAGATSTWLPEPERPTPAEPVRRSGRPGVVGVAVAVAVVVAGVGIVVLIASIVRDPDVHSADGMAELVEDLRDETGSSMVFDAVLYPDYAVVNSVVEEGGDRTDGYYWDGSLDDWGKGRSDKEPFDLADVDGALLGKACQRAKELVQDPEARYVIVARPAAGDPGWLSAHVSNEYGEGGRVSYTLAGEEVRIDTW